MMPIGTMARIIDRAMARLKRIEHYEKRFRAQGIEFTRGFLAAKQAAKPRAWLKFCAWVGSDLEIIAARNVLNVDGRIDYWQCGLEIYKFQRVE